MKNHSCALLIFILLPVSAIAGVSIGSPSNGDHVTSPFNVSATATSCSSQSVRSMGYSMDSGDTTVMTDRMSLDATVSASVGRHTLHVKAWGDNGSVCVSDASIVVSSAADDPSSDSSVVPSNAISVSDLQRLKGWRANRDHSTHGTAEGTMDLVGSPTHDGSARKFHTKYTDRGAERYSVSFGDDRSSKNFFYDAWIYVTSSANYVANIEIDVNQTMENGDTAIFGVQCDGYSGTWDYTENLGSASNPNGHWAHSGAHCDPREWSQYTWHHIQIEYSRTSGGHVTYKYVWFDGDKKTIDKTVFDARALGWAGNLSTNFQVDGAGSSGSSTVYLDDLKISRW